MFFFSVLSSAAVHADVWVLDINDTITIRNDVDPEKTRDVVIFQLVAQNTFLKDEPTTSLEAYIKRTIECKSEQRAAYGNLLEYARILLGQGLITEEVLDNILSLSATYQDALEIANLPENQGFFASLFTLVDFVLRVDHAPTIIFQSFGSEIPLALNVIANRYGDKLTVESEIGIFDEHHHFLFKGNTYRMPDIEEPSGATVSDIRSLIAPKTVMGWKNNYKAGGRKSMFFEPLSEEYPSGLTTRFFDDNSDRFASVYINGELLSIEEGYKFAAPYIHKVDTGKALTDPDYFINLVAHQF